MKFRLIITLTTVSAVLLFVIIYYMLGQDGKITPQKWEKDGMTIWADSSFYEKETMQFNIYLESKDKIISGLREIPTEAFPISTALRGYTEAVLQMNNLSSAEINTFDEDGVTFEWFVYERESAGKMFKYFGVTKKGTAFYLFNFASESKNFDAFQDKFLDWAKQIVVE
jgi:hypothetical protein